MRQHLSYICHIFCRVCQCLPCCCQCCSKPVHVSPVSVPPKTTNCRPEASHDASEAAHSFMSLLCSTYLDMADQQTWLAQSLAQECSGFQENFYLKVCQCWCLQQSVLSLEDGILCLAFTNHGHRKPIQSETLCLGQCSLSCQGENLKYAPTF